VPETKPNSDEPLLLDVKAAAKTLSVSPRTIAELTKLGKLPHVRLQRRVLYPVDRIREYIASITKGGPSQ
jgi:excisionase family DNA binding protein